MPLDAALVATAIEAVLEAGAIHQEHFGRDVRVAKKGAINLVTEVDLAAERRVRALIEERWPGHAILAEESDDPALRGENRGFCWVLDPLDGTTNFAHGVPLFCVSLGLELDGEAVFGAVYDAIRRELYTAERGLGAFLNGEPIHVSEADDLIDALLCTGFPYDVHTRIDELVSLFAAFLGRARSVRRLGSAALDLCYLAAGRLDGFWEATLHPWDTCAGALLVEEAGGQVSRFDGRPYRSRDQSIVASNGRLQSALLDVIRRHQERQGHPATR
jgi:myo-inositol-1(or 4)-monophosphatase